MVLTLIILRMTNSEDPDQIMNEDTDQNAETGM